MTTREFIAKAVKGEVKDGKSVSSVFYTHNCIYSYGYHYPLLIKVGTKWVLNDKGYSATTSKHIAWARPFADYSVKMITSSDNVKQSANKELAEVNADIMACSIRPSTRKSDLYLRAAMLQSLIYFLN